MHCLSHKSASCGLCWQVAELLATPAHHEFLNVNGLNPNVEGARPKRKMLPLYWANVMRKAKSAQQAAGKAASLAHLAMGQFSGDGRTPSPNVGANLLGDSQPLVAFRWTLWPCISAGLYRHSWASDSLGISEGTGWTLRMHSIGAGSGIWERCCACV
ncbi:hypothetical protein O181_025421 [Austropuccinia psidii MF-1]|uniref:Uncharacterized protein n=1 Tax=Austropuccinia psidii MF-1 TaxID=1389203 RepID=A0A9Q3CND9_9BASI|nr:hypothetical protein [Austropuccinia psidii MF-1]